jgi:hypothetical protein
MSIRSVRAYRGKYAHLLPKHHPDFTTSAFPVELAASDPDKGVVLCSGSKTSGVNVRSEEAEGGEDSRVKSGLSSDTAVCQPRSIAKGEDREGGAKEKIATYSESKMSS